VNENDICTITRVHLRTDHAPLVIDLDRPGHSFEAGWAAAEARIAARGTRLTARSSNEQPS
jgi:hypothetical protein